MLIREIQKEDYLKGYMDILVPFIGTNGCNYKDVEDFNDHLINVLSKQDCKIFVIELNNIIIATTTVLIEHKLHHHYMGHIEDVAVLSEFRNKGYGKFIIDHAIKYCDERNCYKTILSCRNDLEIFYNKNGFTTKGISMAKYRQ